MKMGTTLQIPRSYYCLQGVLLLGQYMRFWGLAYLVITICVWLFKREDNFQAPGGSCKP